MSTPGFQQLWWEHRAISGLPCSQEDFYHRVSLAYTFKQYDQITFFLSSDKDFSSSV